MFNFEKLDVWQKSIEFVDKIYIVTEKFPKEEIFGIINQIRRSAISIGLNIAEGAGRKSKREFTHFLSMSYGSLCEVITLLKISLERNYMSPAIYEGLYKECEDIAKMLSGLSKFTKQSSLNIL